MRTLALLAALLLLAFQARAQALQETAEQVPAQGQPGAEDQDLSEDDDQDVTISFPEGERLARQLAGFPTTFAFCKCRRRLFCKTFERNLGSCGRLRLSRLCCK